MNCNYFFNLLPNQSLNSKKYFHLISICIWEIKDGSQLLKMLTSTAVQVYHFLPSFSMG